MMNSVKEKRAIDYLKAFEPQEEPYYLCYSGGKDSDAIRILASLAGVKHDIVNNHTTVDAPETVYYIRTIPNIIISYPERSMWRLIAEKGFPPHKACKILLRGTERARRKVQIEDNWCPKRGVKGARN